MPDEGKTLDALDVVQGTAEDKVVGVRRASVNQKNVLAEINFG